MTEYLTSADLNTLTGYARSKQQSMWMKKRGIPHRQEGKRIIACTEHVRLWISGRSVVVSSGLNLSAIK
jgi:hypothetical protein